MKTYTSQNGKEKLLQLSFPLQLCVGTFSTACASNTGLNVAPKLIHLGCSHKFSPVRPILDPHRKPH